MSKTLPEPEHAAVQFNCFSPPVMLATLVIEFASAGYTVWRYKMNALSRLVVITLVALATFQLAEYQVCTGYGMNAEHWSRLGYVAITLLPPLGLHLMHVLAGEKRRRLVAAAYVTMFGFIAFFLSYPTVFIGYQCTGNYVIFQIGAGSSMLYGLYYYGWLVTSMSLGVRYANILLRAGKRQPTRLRTVRALLVGYLVFLVPTALANSVSPTTRRGIPSIMCGFAVLFALILVFYISPRAARPRK